ncbi:Uncharacterized protein APZ42_012328 [Daphnia magna]|uniref:Uncharacterized protein n=1 Tax=Daphnia magna TaxID=35525 RepID=A0A162RXU7_9CRUS|nr:Uncharacterized protein APZ42_012328 [Daphnia magna]
MLPSIERMRNSKLPKLAGAIKQLALELLKTCTSFNIITDIWSSKKMMGYIEFQCQAVMQDSNSSADAQAYLQNPCK